MIIEDNRTNEERMLRRMDHPSYEADEMCGQTFAEEDTDMATMRDIIDRRGGLSKVDTNKGVNK